jgi:hypothetical protein
LLWNIYAKYEYIGTWMGEEGNGEGERGRKREKEGDGRRGRARERENFLSLFFYPFILPS